MLLGVAVRTPNISDLALSTSIFSKLFLTNMKLVTFLGAAVQKGVNTQKEF